MGEPRLFLNLLLLVLTHTFFVLLPKKSFLDLLFVLLFFSVSFSFRFLVNFTDTFFTLDVYLGHGDAVRVVDPESGKLERQNVEHEISHGLSLNTPILGTTSTSTRRHTRRESKDGMLMFNFL